VLEVPEQIPDLAAWYDSRTDDYFALAGSSITTWLSRAGSMGGAPLTQGTASNQPVRALAVPALGGRNGVQFDGVNDFLAGLAPADWPFLHNNTGRTIVTLEYVDSTGGVDQVLHGTNQFVAGSTGVFWWSRVNSIDGVIYNASGAALNALSSLSAPFRTRDLLRWRAWAHGGGVSTVSASGASVSNPDAGVASALAPVYPFRLGQISGGGGNNFKGYMPQLLFYKRVLTPAELASLGGFFAAEYPGVVA
jgi:hypothetical protein